MKRFWIFLLLAAFLTRLAAALYWDDRVRNAAFVPGVAPSSSPQTAQTAVVPPLPQTTDAPAPSQTADAPPLPQTTDAPAPSQTAQTADVSPLPQTSPTDGPFFFGDSDSYWKLGRALAFGRPYRFDEERRWAIFRTPGYPALLAPLFWTFGENPPVFAARFLGVCFGTANVGLVGFLAFVYFRRRSVAALSGVVAAFEPTLVFESVLVL